MQELGRGEDQIERVWEIEAVGVLGKEEK